MLARRYRRWPSHRAWHLWFNRHYSMEDAFLEGIFGPPQHMPPPQAQVQDVGGFARLADTCWYITPTEFIESS